VLPVCGHLKQIPGESGKFGMSGKNWDRVPIDAQSIDAPLSLAAVFLVVTVASEQAALAKAFSVLGGLDDLVKTVGFRDLSGRLSCVAGIGRDLWDRLDSGKRPKELRPFAPIRGTAHVAPATPGDLLFHIRSERPDLCFEFERILLDSLGACVTVVDEVSGFRYFDARDLLGFVDGTANPTGLDLPADDWDAQMMFFLGRIPPPQMVCSIAAERLRVFTQPRPILGHGP
jgi:porphyrinogen peroxidase